MTKSSRDVIKIVHVPQSMNHIFNVHEYLWICKLDNLDNLHLQHDDNKHMSKLEFGIKFSSLG